MHFMQLNISTENENMMESWGHTPASDSKLWKTNQLTSVALRSRVQIYIFIDE